MVVLMSPALLHGCLLLVVSCLAVSARPGATAPPQDKPQIVDIDAERFSYSPSEVRVKAETTVEFRLRSADTDHGFRIVGTDINVTIPKRGKGTSTVTFVPPKPGRYVFECSKVCGAGHGFMRGTLIAE
jgi:cytochrome c oxidase subunit 2